MHRLPHTDVTLSQRMLALRAALRRYSLRHPIFTWPFEVNPSEVHEVSDLIVVQVLRLYARQSRLIDGGDASGWAQTFTKDGVFASPSYPTPATGTDELVAFAERFAAGNASGSVSRHVITNVDVLPGSDDDHLVVHAYLQIVTTPRGELSELVRLTTITDQLVRIDGHWQVAHRQVVRDDAEPAIEAAGDNS
jgi:uncharacterized protein (TIGR02246 family)